LALQYDPASGISNHHSSNVAYDADDGWPLEGGSWANLGYNLTQTAPNEVVSPQVGLFSRGNAASDIHVRNLRLRYV